MRALVRSKLVELNDVRVLELHPDARLVEEHLNEVVVVLEVRKNPLHHHEPVVAIGAGVPRQKNLGHSAEREAPEDIIASKLSENRKVDWRCGYFDRCGFLRHFVLSPQGKVSQRTA